MYIQLPAVEMLLSIKSLSGHDLTFLGGCETLNNMCIKQKAYPTFFPIQFSLKSWSCYVQEALIDD